MAKPGRKFNKFSFIIIGAVIILALSLTVFSNKGAKEWENTYKSYELTGDSDIEKYPFSIHFIDVSQGDCTLIKSDFGNILIDCGEADEKNRVESYLNKYGIKSIDYLFATHPHSDHIGCMSSIVNDYKIGKFFICETDEEDIPTSSCYKKLLEALDKNEVDCCFAEGGETFSLGDVKIEIIAPVKIIKGDLNNNSVVLKISYLDMTVLMAGDCESKEEKTILEKGFDINCDILKVGHHGSKSSSSNAFLKAVSPESAVISLGQGNSYGHPHEEALKRLGKYCKNIFRTDKNGTVVICKNSKEEIIRTEKESQ